MSDYLRHLLHEVDYLADRTADLSEEDFLADETAQRAFVRSLEVIGEATKQLPSAWRASHPEIDWRAIAGLRDRLIHGYFGVDYEIVWEVASGRIPSLRAPITRLIEEADE